MKAANKYLGKEIFEDLLVQAKSLQTDDLTKFIHQKIPYLPHEELCDLAAFMTSTAIKTRLSPDRSHKQPSGELKLTERMAAATNKGKKFRFSPENGWLFDTMTVDGVRKFLKDFTIDDCLEAENYYMKMAASHADQAAIWEARRRLLVKSGEVTLGAYYESNVVAA